MNSQVERDRPNTRVSLADFALNSVLSVYSVVKNESQISPRRTQSSRRNAASQVPHGFVIYNGCRKLLKTSTRLVGATAFVVTRQHFGVIMPEHLAF